MKIHFHVAESTKEQIDTLCEEFGCDRNLLLVMALDRLEKDIKRHTSFARKTAYMSFLHNIGERKQ